MQNVNLYAHKNGILVHKGQKHENNSKLWVSQNEQNITWT